MNYEFLTQLQQAASDEEKSWILTEVYLKVLPPDVTEAALAAAVPHWFDAAILAALLQTDAADAERLYQELQKLSFIEPFAELGHNVHDMTRAGVLRYYFLKAQPELFKKYSVYATGYFIQFKDDSQNVVEAIYHSLTIVQVQAEGMKAFVEMMKEFLQARNYSAANNLLRNAQELVNLSVLHGADAATVEQQAYYLAKALSTSDKPEELQQAAKMFRPHEDVSQYQEPEQLQELVKRGKHDFLTQKLDEARQIGDSSRQKTWLRELGEISLLEDKDYEAAVQKYTDALKLEPNDSAALAKRGEAYRMLGQYAAAVADLNRALELEPKYVMALAVRGAAYRQTGQYDAAVADLTRALEFEPKNAWALAHRGETYRQMGQYEVAVADLTRALELDPKDAWALAVRGAAYGQMGQYETAVADLTRALEFEPKNAWALAHRGETYRQMGQYEAAAADLTRAIERNPKYARALASRGAAYRQMGQYEAAAADLTRAIELDQNVAWGLAHRGEAYLQMGQYEAAVADLTRAIELDPKDAWALAVRGETYRQMGQYEAAVADLTRAIELEPNVAWGLASRGAAYRQMGQYEAAVADLTRALELDPKYAWAVAHRGAAYRQMGQYEAAVADLTRAIELDPKDWWYYERGLTYLAMKQPEQAQPDFAEAIRLSTQKYQENPQDHGNTFNLALYHLITNKTEEAERLFREALFTKDRGLIQEMIDDLTNFLCLFPSHPQAQAIRGELQGLSLQRMV